MTQFIMKMMNRIRYCRTTTDPDKDQYHIIKTSSLSELGHVNYIVFDSTTTLNQGTYKIDSMFLTSNFYKYQTESFENDLKAFKAQLILNNIKKEDAPNRKMIERNRKKSPYLSHISHVSPFNNLNNNYTDPHFDNLEANKL